MSTFFFFNDTATTEIYTLSLHDALPILNVSGVSDVLTVKIKDSGGTTNGGVDESATQPLGITIQAVNDKPVIGTVAPTTENQEPSQTDSFSVRDEEKNGASIVVTASVSS